MAAETIRYGNSGKIAPPTVPPPQFTPEEKAAHEKLLEENRAKLAIAGRAHWQLAHERRHWTPASFQEWLDGIPQFGCACRRDADEYIAAHPPPLDDAEGMFVWFWEFHEDKNLKLGKPSFPLPTARARWGR